MMDISPDEAAESLAAIQAMVRKTRHSIASSGAYIFLIITGIVWLAGFVSNQFLTGPILGYIWGVMSVLGSVVAVILGTRMGRRVRSAGVNHSARGAIIFWLLLALYAVAIIAIARPTDGKQVTMFIVLFIMIGQLSMGLLLSFSSVWWALPISALALAGYFLLPAYFYLWMGVLVGGGMILLGLYIHSRW